MANTKEQLSAHCDKVAFAIVAVITVILIYLVSGGEDIQKSKNAIDNTIKTINLNGANQDAKRRPQEVADLKREIDKLWFRTDLSSDPFHPYSFYSQPVVVRLYKQATIHESVHKKPTWESITIKRDNTEKKPVIQLTFTIGKMANVKLKSIIIERQKSETATWQEIGSPEFTMGDNPKSVTFVDKTVEAGNSYCYRIISQVEKTLVESTGATRNWGKDSVAKQISDVAPPPAFLKTFIVPKDEQLSLFQASPVEKTGTIGSAYFNVKHYDYKMGKIQRITMTLLKECMDRKPTKADLVPFTPYYMLWVRKNKETGNMEAILRHWKKPGIKLTVVQGKWYPSTITVPAPWTKNVTSTTPEKTVATDTTKNGENLVAPENVEPLKPLEEPETPTEPAGKPKKADTGDDAGGLIK